MFEPILKIEAYERQDRDVEQLFHQLLDELEGQPVHLTMNAARKLYAYLSAEWHLACVKQMEKEGEASCHTFEDTEQFFFEQHTDFCDDAHGFVKAKRPYKKTKVAAVKR